MDYNFSSRLEGLQANAIREIFHLLEDPEVISFAGGFPSPDCLPTEEVNRITSEILSGPKAQTVLQYGGTEGYQPLRYSALEFLKRSGIESGLDNSLIISGGQQAIDLTCKAFLNKGDIVLVEDPTYLAVLHILKTYEAVVYGVKSDDDGLNIADLEEKIKKYNPKFVYLVPTFSNPTGKTVSVEKRKQIVDIIDKYHTVLLEDDPYSELRYHGERVPAIKSFDRDDRVIYVTSFSKTISPGLRTGIVVASKEVIRKLTILKQATDVHTSLLSQAIVDLYLREGKMDPHLLDMVPKYKVKLDTMLDCIKKYMPKEAKFTSPEGGLFIWGEFPEYVNAEEAFVRAVKEYKVAYVVGTSFYADGRGKNTIRLNFSMSTVEQIETGMQRLGKLFTELVAKEQNK